MKFRASLDHLNEDIKECLAILATRSMDQNAADFLGDDIELDLKRDGLLVVIGGYIDDGVRSGTIFETKPWLTYLKRKQITPEDLTVMLDLVGIDGALEVLRVRKS